MADPPAEAERMGLWEDDVVELFVGARADQATTYQEFEWAPNGETLDVTVDLPQKDFEWHGAGESTAVIDRRAKIWRVEARIPWSAFAAAAPKAGDRWRANLFRHDAASGAFLTWNPTLATTTHAPERFGWLEFVE
jgi:hypothetical protein